jgi:hypothetical protein
MRLIIRRKLGALIRPNAEFRAKKTNQKKKVEREVVERIPGWI